MATRDPGKYLGMIVRSVESIEIAIAMRKKRGFREQRFAATPGQRKAYEILNGGPTPERVWC